LGGNGPFAPPEYAYGRIQGGDWADRPTLKPTKVTLFAMILYNSENNIRDLRPFSLYFFVTALL